MDNSSRYRGNSSGTHGYEEPDLVRTNSPLRQFAPGMNHKNWDTYDKPSESPQTYKYGTLGSTPQSCSLDEHSRPRRSYSSLGSYDDPSHSASRYSCGDAAKSYGSGRSQSSLGNYGDASCSPGHQYRSKYARDWEHAKRMGRPIVKAVPEEPEEVPASPTTPGAPKAGDSQKIPYRRYGASSYASKPAADIRETKSDDNKGINMKQADIERIMRKYLGDEEVDQRIDARKKKYGVLGHAADPNIKDIRSYLHKDNSKSASQAESSEHKPLSSSNHPTISALGGMAGTMPMPAEAPRPPSYLRHHLDGISGGYNGSRVAEPLPCHRPEYSPPPSRLSEYTVPEQELPGTPHSQCRSPEYDSDTSNRSTPLPMPPPPPKYSRRMEDGLPLNRGTPKRNQFTDPTLEELEELQSLHSFSRLSCSPETHRSSPDSTSQRCEDIPVESSQRPRDSDTRHKRSPERYHIPIYHGSPRYAEGKARSRDHEQDDKRHKTRSRDNEQEDKRQRFDDGPRGFFEGRRRSTGGGRRRRLIDLLDLGGGWPDIGEFFDRPSFFDRESLFDDVFSRRRNTDAGRYDRYEDDASSGNEDASDGSGAWKNYTTKERKFKEKERERTLSPGASGSPRPRGTPVQSPDGQEHPGFERSRSREWSEREVKRCEFGKPRKNPDDSRGTGSKGSGEYDNDDQEKRTSSEHTEAHNSKVESEKRSHGFQRSRFERRSSLPTDSLSRTPMQRPLRVPQAAEDFPDRPSRRQSLFDNYRFKFGSFGTFHPHKEESGVDKDTLRFQDFDDLAAKVYEAQEKVRHQQPPAQHEQQGEDCKEVKDGSEKEEAKEEVKEESKSDHKCTEVDMK